MDENVLQLEIFNDHDTDALIDDYIRAELVRTIKAKKSVKTINYASTKYEAMLDKRIIGLINARISIRKLNMVE